MFLLEKRHRGFAAVHESASGMPDYADVFLGLDNREVRLSAQYTANRENSEFCKALSYRRSKSQSACWRSRHYGCGQRGLG
jgi:hypothetical protein